MPKSPIKPMRWTAIQERALGLAFEGRWTRDEIADKCSVSPRTMYYWLDHLEFKQRLEALRSDFAASIADVAYASKAKRIRALDQVAESARREYEARPLLQEVRPTRDGPITNEHFNAEAHGAFRGALDDIAKELGERSSKLNVAATIQGTLGHDHAFTLDPEAAGHARKLLRRLSAIRAADASGAGVSSE
jgi:transposase-like protein